MTALHPVLRPEERRRLLVEGLERFAAGRFFAAHESWEEIWRSTTPEPRDLFQGLVQVAAAMHHWRDRGRPDVARRVLGKARRRLDPLPSPCCGLDVAGLVAAIRRWEAWDPAAGCPPPPSPAPVVADPDALG